MSSNDRIFLSPPHMSGNELKYIQEAFEQNWIAPLGPNVEAFEKQAEQYLGQAVHCVAMSSGTAAIHIALSLLGVQAGDEVFCSSLTFVASANPIAYIGATPVYIDSSPKNWNMCPLSLEAAFKAKKQKNKLPKAVVAVDLFGQSADYDQIVKLCQEYKVPLIEDSAEAFGASYRGQKCGTFGQYGILSFNGNKIITTSGGGMLVCHSLAEKQKAIHLITQARDPADFYLHSDLGFNYRMSNILAGIGRAQLEVLDERVQQKTRVNQLYKKHLTEVEWLEFMPEPTNCENNYWLSAIRLKETAPTSVSAIIKKYAEHNIDARHIWKPLHTQPLYKNCDFFSVHPNPISEDLFERGICLPSGTQLTEKQIIKICQILKEI